MRTMRRLFHVLLGELATTRIFYPVHRIIYRLSGARIFIRSRRLS